MSNGHRQGKKSREEEAARKVIAQAKRSVYEALSSPRKQGRQDRRARKGFQ